MKINRIKIENILSIGSMELCFSNFGMVLVDGFDFDKGRSNGSGKSSIMNSLCWGLFGELPRKITASEILKRGCKSGFVQIEVECGSDVYTITRERPNKLSFLKNGNAEVLTQESFEKILGFDYERFVLSIYCPQDSRSRFIFLNDVGKKDFLLKLMNLDQFGAGKEKADCIVNQLEKELDSKKALISQLKFSIEAAASSWRDPGPLKESILNIKKEVDVLKKDLAGIEASPPDLTKYLELDKMISQKKERFSAIRAEISFLQKTKRALSAKIVPFVSGGSEVSCPSCFASLNLKAGVLLKKEDSDGARLAYEKECESIRSEVQQIDLEIEEKSAMLSGCEAVEKLSLEMDIAKKKDSGEYIKSTARIKELNEKILININKIKDLESALAKNEVIQSQIDLSKKSIEEHQDEVEEKNKKLHLFREVSSVFSPVGAPAYIMDSVVDVFNEKIGDYICAIWPNASYVLQSFKENKDKSIKAKFSESLIIDGKPCSIGSISGGELTSLSLAVDFALFETVSTMFGIDSNVMVFDEPFTGIDSIGREIMLDILKKMSERRQVLVIDHANEVKASFDTIIKVEKRNGTSALA